MATAPPHDVILVLGAQVRPDGAPSEALRRRMALALRCYQARPVPIISCGGQGRNEPESEGAFMRGWFMARGVKDALAIAETTSRDTLQNIANAKEIMDAHGLRRALVITSDYHVRRALAICRRLGVEATGRGSPSDRRYFIKNHAREALAWGKFALTWLLSLWYRIRLHLRGERE